MIFSIPIKTRRCAIRVPGSGKEVPGLGPGGPAKNKNGVSSMFPRACGPLTCPTPG